MGKEIVTIKYCPLCHDRHVYELVVKRTLSLISGQPDLVKMAFGRSAEEAMTEERTISFTKTFQCPNKGQYFSYTFSLEEKPMARIWNVSIGDEVSAREDPQVRK